MRKIPGALVLPAIVSAMLVFPARANAQETAAVQERCTFEGLSAEDRRRYQSRYRRRVRLDGQEVADRWVYERVCMTAEQRRAQRQAANGIDEERECKAVSRPVTSMDGSMTVGIGRVCK